MKPGKPLEDLSAANRWKLLTLTTISTVLLMLSATPAFIDPIVTSARYVFRLSKGSTLYNLLKTELEGAFIEAYIFNITNVEKFMSGEDYKLKVEEVGPFTYQEHRHHEDFFLDEESQTLRYTPRIKAHFHRKYSVADPKDVNISVPNIPMLALGSTLGSYPYWTQMAFNLLTTRLNANPIIQKSAHDFMWGYEEPLIALGNQLLPGWINFKKLGVLDRLYDQTVRDTVVLGTTDADKFLIKSVNGEGGIRIRGYDPDIRDRCNTFVDTYEGLSYRPGLTPETKLRMYRSVFCRILDLQYVDSKVLDYGPKVFVYRLSNTTFTKNSENGCLCRKVCIDGMADLSSCFYGFGAAFSQAHFLDADPKLYERIEGIKPDVDKHGSVFIVDPNLGSVLDTRVSFQLNVVVENADFNVRTKPFSHMVLPVLYFRIIQPELPEDTKSAFRCMYKVLPYVLIAVQVVLVLVAMGLLAYAMRFVRFAWLCKKVMGIQMKKDENSGPVYEEPLIEKNSNFSLELTLNKDCVDRNSVSA